MSSKQRDPKEGVAYGHWKSDGDRISAFLLETIPSRALHCPPFRRIEGAACLCVDKAGPARHFMLKGERAGIRRQYALKGYMKKLPLVTITWDASRYGMGATLQLEGKFMEYFSIQITELDQQVLETPAGAHEGQQVWEALAGLIARRHWDVYWQFQRATLQIRSDNIGALTMLTKLKGGSRPLTLIAREYALDLGRAQWKPDLAVNELRPRSRSHCRNVSNVRNRSPQRLLTSNGGELWRCNLT